MPYYRRVVLKYVMFRENIKILKEKGLFRHLKDRESPQGARIKLDGIEFVNFSSNDYLGLANHSYIIKKIRQALDEYGYGSGASRLLCGGSKLHEKLEYKVAEFKETDASIVFNCGYAANTGILPAIADAGSALFSDELNHASIIDGCRLSSSKTFIYRHKNMDHLEKLIKSSDAKNKVIVTDTVFSMDGDIAPIADLSSICHKYGALLYLDDAHGTGVLGNGRGALSHFKIRPEPWILQMGTFSKALGSFGAFLAGSSDIVQWLVNNARSFIYSTALPSCIVAASLVSIELIETRAEIVGKLWENRNKTADSLANMGYNITGSETPIIPIKTADIESTLIISQYLLKKGIYAPAIRPPTVKEPRIRLNITASHTDEDIERLIQALKEVKLNYGKRVFCHRN